MTASSDINSGQSLDSPRRTREEWSRFLRSHGIRPTRSMGQNFLVETVIVDDMVAVAGIEPGDRVVEVGPGMGILTRALLDRGAHVLAVELDGGLVRLLQAEMGHAEHLTIVERDARYVDVQEWANELPWQVVANLPYSTGTAIVRRFLELPNPPNMLTVMVQREVAERMDAQPSHMSLLSLAIQTYADPELAFLVPPDVFEPPPMVESAVIQLRALPEPRVSAADRETLFALATMAFQRKRKTISNGLSQGLGIGRSEVDEVLTGIGIDPRLRPQALDLDQWIHIARAYPQ